MTLDTLSSDALFDYLEALLAADQSAEMRWAQLIDYLQEKAPQPYWEQLRELDIPLALAGIERAFHEIEAGAVLEPEIVAIWVGLLQFLGDDEESELYALYSQPTKGYNADDLEWACEVDDQPKGYITLPILDEAIGIIKEAQANDANARMLLDWLLPLAFAGFILDELSRDGRLPFRPTNAAGQLYLTVGHDSGDGVNLTPIR